MKKFLTLIFAIAITGSLALAQDTTNHTSNHPVTKAEKKEGGREGQDIAPDRLGEERRWQDRLRQ